MTKQNLIYHFFVSIIFLTSYGCQQKTSNKRLNVSSKIEVVTPLKEIIKKSGAIEKTTVIFKSNDMGNTWSSFDNGIPNDATLSGIKQFGKKVYVTTDYHGVFVASNGQDNWAALNFEQLKGLDINCIEVDANKLIVGTLRHGIFVSNNDGLSWKQSKKNIKNIPVRAFIKTEKRLYAGTDLGIFESSDMGDTWLHVFGKMQILGFTSLNDKIYAATQNGALVCNGNSSSWKSIYKGDALHDIGNDGKYIYAMTIGQQLLKTQNDGESWENAQNGIIYPVNFYTNELQHIGNNIFSAQWIGIYHSSNNGNSWRRLNDLPDSTAFSTLAITDYGIIAGISIR